MEGFVEWTFEGGLNPSGRMQVGADGYPPVIHPACMIVHEVSGHFVKMSGTAIILVYYRLKQ